MQHTRPYNPSVSVDCVVFGFDGKALNVLLIERNIKENTGNYNDKKLPGSIIYTDETLDNAASRVLTELTGLKNIPLSQFRSFGDPNRSSNPRDVLWLERTTHTKITRIVTVAYVALIKINRKIILESEDRTANWYDVKEIEQMTLAFDHRQIIAKGLEHIMHWLKLEPHLMFKLLPRKFTLSQFRLLYDAVNQTQSDVRNFQKKVLQWKNLAPLDEFKTGMPHRAARLYKYHTNPKSAQKDT
ncbi:MAG: NUDIX domain-containing protein [Prevotellaceae bacterium]|jgi:ADP-ribose pyrophosphatase YjhB (NUDIX family)|nr:NUDIX domain-containing protein [Prevotellaceae bacterium]